MPAASTPSTLMALRPMRGRRAHRITQLLQECISPSSSHSDQKFDGILVSGKCVYESGCGSNSFLVGASKQQAVSFRVAYGRSGSENDNASGGGYDTPDGSRALDLGFLVPLPSSFNSGEFRLVGSIGNWCTPPLRGSQGRRGSFSLGVLKAHTC